MSETIKLADVKPEGTYVVQVLCGDCRAVLLESVDIIGDELKDAWSNLVLTKGFNTPKCKQGCRSTYSDFNINSDMTIVERQEALFA